MSHGRRSKKALCRNPSVEEIRRAQATADLTNAQCADLVCVSEHTWESWVMEGPNGRQMPAGAWKLFRYEVGMLAPPKTRL